MIDLAHSDLYVMFKQTHTVSSFSTDEVYLLWRFSKRMMIYIIFINLLALWSLFFRGNIKCENRCNYWLYGLQIRINCFQRFQVLCNFHSFVILLVVAMRSLFVSAPVLNVTAVFSSVFGLLHRTLLGRRAAALKINKGLYCALLMVGRNSNTQKKVLWRFVLCAHLLTFIFFQQQQTQNPRMLAVQFCKMDIDSP